MKNTDQSTELTQLVHGLALSDYTTCVALEHDGLLKLTIRRRHTTSVSPTDVSIILPNNMVIFCPTCASKTPHECLRCFLFSKHLFQEDFK